MYVTVYWESQLLLKPKFLKHFLILKIQKHKWVKNMLCFHSSDPTLLTWMLSVWDVASLDVWWLVAHCTWSISPTHLLWNLLEIQMKSLPLLRRKKKQQVEAEIDRKAKMLDQAPKGASRIIFLNPLKRYQDLDQWNFLGKYLKQFYTIVFRSLGITIHLFCKNTFNLLKKTVKRLPKITEDLYFI